MMDDSLLLENQICFRVYSLERAIQQAYKPLLGSLDITYPQYLVLLVLWKKGEMTVGQLCEILGLDTGTVSPLVKRLERKMLIERTRLPSDERRVLITLTPKGEALEIRAKSIPHDLIHALFGKQGEAEATEMYWTLRSVLDDALRTINVSQ